MDQVPDVQATVHSSYGGGLQTYAPKEIWLRAAFNHGSLSSLVCLQDIRKCIMSSSLSLNSGHVVPRVWLKAFLFFCSMYAPASILGLMQALGGCPLGLMLSSPTVDEACNECNRFMRDVDVLLRASSSIFFFRYCKIALSTVFSHFSLITISQPDHTYKLGWLTSEELHFF